MDVLSDLLRMLAGMFDFLSVYLSYRRFKIERDDGCDQINARRPTGRRPKHLRE
jgi:hypothetical protein